jgi:aminoglycoside 6-adenylyltransferase
MRSENEMLDLILQTAADDDRIRAVIMNGSRVNPNAAADPFQDYDIVYFVTDVRSFKQDPDWISRFGELMILQLPEDMQDPAPSIDNGFAYLMQFTDGNRIDLGIYPLDMVHDKTRDSLTVVLLDKDGLIGRLPSASESSYLPSAPTEKSFCDCCNEFWWVSPYAAKGLWRREIIYARYVLDAILREELMKMLVWHIGLKTDYSENPGKWGKYFEKHLEPQIWQRLLKTYPRAEYEATWDALEGMCDLFRDLALRIAKELDFAYPARDDERVSAYLKRIRRLPRDAVETC